MYLFMNRIDAGRRLARALSDYTGRKDVLVLALPRGGVPVAYEVARALNAPMDLFPVRKLGTPDNPEVAMGAIAPGGVRVLNDDIIREHFISESAIEKTAAIEREELKRRESVYRKNRPVPDMRGRCVILVDDGLATGASMRAAVTALRRFEPKEIIVAVPASEPDTCMAFANEVDDIVCAETPHPFHAVGLWYNDFSQTTDEEVQHYMRRAEKVLPPAEPDRRNLIN